MVPLTASHELGHFVPIADLGQCGSNRIFTEQLEMHASDQSLPRVPDAASVHGAVTIYDEC